MPPRTWAPAASGVVTGLNAREHPSGEPVARRFDAPLPITAPLQPAPDTRPVWVLLGRRTGDNSQLLAAAEALGLPYETIPLRFAGAAKPNVLLGTSLRTLANPEVLPAGSPRLVLSCGRRSPPVARWIQQRSSGHTRLVHFGRPWGPTRWFDLIVTTAQYGLPDRQHIICNTLPFLAPSRPQSLPASLRASLAALPRPWTVVLAGGASRPYVFDAVAARGLAEAANAIAARDGGSLLFLPSPRTPSACIETIAPLLRAPAYIWRSEHDDNPYRALLQLGDRFIVTADSAMMVAEVLTAAKPLQIFDLPRQPDRRHRAVSQLQALTRHSRLAARLYGWLHEQGLLTSTRELGDYHQRLRAAGAFDAPGVAVALAARERTATLARIRQLLR